MINYTTAADTSRNCLLLSGRHKRALANAAMLMPNFELGLRYDDGDTETSFGMVFKSVGVARAVSRQRT